MRKISTLLILCVVLLSVSFSAEAKKPKYKVLALSDKGGGHVLFSKAGREWLSKLAVEKNFDITYISSPNDINTEMLNQYKLFIQLDYPPYPWKRESQAALEQYLESGKGAWIGFHHPTLLGVFDGYPMWDWFSKFMGDIKFKQHIPGGTKALLTVEDKKHPVMKHVPASFITNDEWYIYNQSPRPNVHVIASIDESTYNPVKTVKMGDHPVIWTNEHVKSKNLYIAMGHFPELFEDVPFTTIFKNAIAWALKK